MSAIEAWAGQQGATTLFLQAVADNTPAIKLYESAGFRHRVTTRYMVKG